MGNYQTPKWTVTHGPPRDIDGLPQWVEWNGETFETPVFEEIQRLCFDSVSESLEGESIEPDGVTFNGCPSWPLALHII
tara:strand:+ start:1984 stop:2220 length:237 start_codon:yes stop_codon:yes gene_type:complete